MGSQEVVDSTYYLPRIACYGLYQGWSPDLWMLKKTPSQKKTLHFFSGADVFIFSNHSYEDSSRITRDSLLLSHKN